MPKVFGVRCCLMCDVISNNSRLRASVISYSIQAQFSFSLSLLRLAPLLVARFTYVSLTFCCMHFGYIVPDRNILPAYIIKHYWNLFTFHVENYTIESFKWVWVLCYVARNTFIEKLENHIVLFTYNNKCCANIFMVHWNFIQVPILYRTIRCFSTYFWRYNLGKVFGVHITVNVIADAVMYADVAML